MERYSYDRKNKAVIVAPFTGSRKANTIVPVSLIEEVRKLGLSSYEWEGVLRFYGLAETSKSVRTAKFADLLGVYDEKATLAYFFANWEDSEWLYAKGPFAIFVADENYDGYSKPPTLEEIKALNLTAKVERNNPHARVVVVSYHDEPCDNCGDHTGSDDYDGGCWVCQPLSNLVLSLADNGTLTVS